MDAQLRKALGLSDGRATTIDRAHESWDRDGRILRAFVNRVRADRAANGLQPIPHKLEAELDADDRRKRVKRWRLAGCQLSIGLGLALFGASGCGASPQALAEQTTYADAPNGCGLGDAPSANDSGVCCPIGAPVYGPDGYCYPHSEPSSGCPSGWSSAVNAPELCCPAFDSFVGADGDCYMPIAR
jgi:hypothetical protein